MRRAADICSLARSRDQNAAFRAGVRDRLGNFCRLRLGLVVQDEFEIDVALQNGVVVVGEERHHLGTVVAGPDVQPLHVVDLVRHVGFEQHRAVGDRMTDMPLFLREETYINIPLQSTYDRAFQGVPEIFRGQLEKETNGKRRKR